MKKNSHNQRGYTVVEMLIYGVILISLIGALTATTLTLRTVYERNSGFRVLNHTGEIILERFVREVRESGAINVGGSAFDTQRGILSLTNGATTTVFTAATSSIELSINGETVNDFIPSAVIVDAFTIRRYSNATSEMAELRMTLSTAGTYASTTKTFYASAILRGSYAD